MKATIEKQSESPVNLRERPLAGGNLVLHGRYSSGGDAVQMLTLEEVLSWPDLQL